MSKLDIIIAAASLIFMIGFLIKILAHKDGDETEPMDKGTTEKNDNVWSIILSVLIAIPAFVYELLREIFWRRRKY